MLCGDEHRVHVVRDDVRRAYANRDAASDGGNGPALVRPSNVDDFRCRVWRLFEARAFYHERRGVPGLGRNFICDRFFSTTSTST